MIQPKNEVSVTNSKPYHTPEWAKHVVWYQIFPERFRNGDLGNDPTAQRIQGELKFEDSWEITPWTSDWYHRAEWERALGPEFRDGVFYRRYGGDLQGIIDKLDYLQDLGIGAIFLNPVFDAVSLHKYDTSHYRHVDRFFGPDPEGDAAIMEQENPVDPTTWQWTTADKLFLRLIEEVHNRGMKIIIDGVFNHTGTDFWAFRDLKEKQQESSFAHWYEVISYADPNAHEPTEFDYQAWWGVKDLPEFREFEGKLAKPIQAHIAAITRRWMDPNNDGNPSDGIDGWRLDVPEENGMPFWKDWCRVVRQINPDAYISGEIWDEKAVHWVNSELFTAVMNYQFAKAVQDYMIDREIAAHDFSQRLANVRKHFPEEANFVVQNLMDSHDTPRLASMILNPGREYDTLGKPEEGFDVQKPNIQERRVQRLIALFQFTYIGAPMIYYGTEAGMWGADDPDNRKPMLWPEFKYEDEVTHPLGQNRTPDENRFDDELFAWYKQLISIRNSYEAFQTGEYRELYVDSDRDILAFARVLTPDEFAIIIINRSKQKHDVEISLSTLEVPGKTLTDLLAGQEYSVTGNIVKCTVAPVSGLILS